MGRIKSNYPNGIFVVRNKSKAKNEVTICLVYYVNCIGVARSTGIRINVADWDNVRGRVRQKNADAFRLNEKLKAFRDHIDDQIRKYDGPLTPKVMRDIMDGKLEIKVSVSENDFIQYAHDYNEQRYKLQKVSYSTYYNHGLYIEQFRRYILKETGMKILPFSDLKLDLFERYKEYRLNNGNTKEGINKMLTPLFKAVLYAKNNELVSVSNASAITDAYFQVKQRKYVSDVEDKEVRYLTPEQLNEFINLYNKVPHNRTREIMEMFLFSFHACGLRVSDVITLEWKQIDWESEVISKNLFKGKVPNDIPLSAPAMEILRRWQQKGYNKRFVFNLLPEDFDLDDEAELDMKRKSKNRTLQMSLNAVGYKMGLDWNLSMHVARHTFAVFALNRGISLHMISILLGHGSVTTTEKVYAHFLPDTLKENVRDKLSFTSFVPAV